MNQALTTLMTVLRLLPVIIGAIKALEEVWPESGQGATKLEALRKIMETTDAGISAIWPAIEQVVAVMVGLMNQTKKL